ncbi:MAG: AI-2E family transporter [Candidatus Methylopumilus sp.]|nr:AI-2E family transporter [Candidatus Methylopumilus sp.]
MTTKRENHSPDYRLILLIAGGIALMYLLGPVLSPFLIAAVLAYIGSPIVDSLSNIQFGKFTLSRSSSSMLVMLMMIASLILLVFIIAPVFQQEFLLFIERLPKFIISSKSIIEPWLAKHLGVSLNIDAAQIQSIFTQNWKAASQYIAKILLSISTKGLAIIGWLGNVILITMVLFYLLRDWHQFISQIAKLIPRRFISTTSKIFSEIDEVLASFLRGQLSVMVAMSAFYAIGLWLSGLDLALPIGVVTGLLGFVPYLGFGLGLVLAIFAGALQFASLGDIYPVLLVFTIGQVLESFILTPTLVGERIGLHPVTVLFALIACGQLFGFVGILFALPISAAIAVGMKYAQIRYLASDEYLH